MVEGIRACHSGTGRAFSHPSGSPTSGGVIGGRNGAAARMHALQHIGNSSVHPAGGQAAGPRTFGSSYEPVKVTTQ